MRKSKFFQVDSSSCDCLFNQGLGQALLCDSLYLNLLAESHFTKSKLLPYRGKAACHSAASFEGVYNIVAITVYNVNVNMCELTHQLVTNNLKPSTV